MINRVVLVGRLTKDVDLKYTQSGIAVARFTLAVNRAFKTAGGEQEADFISCVAWRKVAENTANFLKKGSLAGVDGRIQTGSYEKDGARIYTTEVIADSVQFLEPRSSSSDGGQAPRQTNTHNQTQNTQGRPEPSQEDAPPNYGDDDLPF